MITLKNNKTRISIQKSNHLNLGSSSRFAKVELNKFIITNGFSNKNKHLWKIYSFNNIEECIILLKKYVKNNMESHINSILQFYSQLKK